jgi:predicted dienelactone hydrolase
MNPAAIGGALRPQTGSHDDVFRQRASVCEYKAADLASVADQLERLNKDQAERLAGRLDMGRFGALGHSFGAMPRWSGADRTGGAGRRSTSMVHCGVK